MTYRLSGRIDGLMCDDCSEPLAGATLRLVRTTGGVDASHDAAADPKHTVAQLSQEAAADRNAELLAEAVLAADGTFTAEFGADYDGGAFDVDLYCGTLTGHPVPPKPLQFRLTTLAPQWRTAAPEAQEEPAELQIAAWEYEIPQRIWCFIRGLLGWWTICGHVTVCGTDVPVPGVQVSAFDVDWLQDDALGSATTDASGHFRIDYTTAQFTRTPFSPLINFELVPGPDVYFRIDGFGSVLLAEPRSRGRQKDRQNVGPCFCAELCVDAQPPVTDAYPWFDHVGNYKLLTGLDSAPGGTGRTVAGGLAFYSTIPLNGVLGQKFNGQPLVYRFETSAGPVRPAQIARTQIGTWERHTLFITETKAVVVNGTNGPDEIAVTPDADGWIAVPQDHDLLTGIFVPNNQLLNLDTTTLTTQSHDLALITAGNSTAPAGLATDQFFSLRMVSRAATTPPAAAVETGRCDRIAIANTTYLNVEKQGSWVPLRVNDIGALSLDVQELAAGACTKITTSLTVLYTAAHPNLGPVSITVIGPGGPYHYVLPPVVPDYFGVVTDLLNAANQHVKIANLPACGYQLSALAPLLVTDGISSPQPRSDFLVFTKA